MQCGTDPDAAAVGDVNGEAVVILNDEDEPLMGPADNSEDGAMVSAPSPRKGCTDSSHADFRLNEQISITGTIVGFEDGLVQVKLATGIQSFERSQLVKPGKTVAYLPIELKGERVLSQEGPSQWRLDSASARAQGMNGIGYKKTKNLQSILGPGVQWGQIVHGVDEGDGWLRCDLDFKDLVAQPRPQVPQVSAAPRRAVGEPSRRVFPDIFSQVSSFFAPRTTSIASNAPIPAVDGTPDMLEQAATSGSAATVTTLIERIAASLNGRVVDQQRASEYGKIIFAKVEGTVDPDEIAVIFNEMVLEIQRSLRAGEWLAPAPGRRGGKANAKGIKTFDRQDPLDAYTARGPDPRREIGEGI